MRKTAVRMTDNAASIGYQNGWNDAYANYKSRIAELEASVPTPEAYDAACKALAHWRKEAKRLAKIAGIAPREMALEKSAGEAPNRRD